MEKDKNTKAAVKVKPRIIKESTKMLKNTKEAKQLAIFQREKEQSKVESMEQCDFTPEIIKSSFENSNWMEMEARTDRTFGSILPLLQDTPQKTLKEGLEAEITLANIRIQTIKVVYRGLCNLNNHNNRIFIKKGWKFTFQSPQSRKPFGTVDFEYFFVNENKINRDDLSSSIMRNVDYYMLISISFLEYLLSPPAITNDADFIKLINEVLDSFTLCSSGKEYLDVGQLYAIVKYNNVYNKYYNNSNPPVAIDRQEVSIPPNRQSVPTFWTTNDINKRVANIKEIYSMTCDINKIVALYSIEGLGFNIQIPKRPFFETHDGAAATISGRYFNVYTESTILSTTEPRWDQTMRTVRTSPGSVTYLFDQMNVLYLCYFLNSIIDSQAIINEIWGDADATDLINYTAIELSKLIILVLRDQRLNWIIKKAILFDLFFYLLNYPHNNTIGKIIEYYNLTYDKFSQRLYIYPVLYHLISSVFYFDNALRKPNYQFNLINNNLDSLCHDNKNSDIYRLLMIYNVIKKSDEQDLLNHLSETFHLSSTNPPYDNIWPSDDPIYNNVSEQVPGLDSIPDNYLDNGTRTKIYRFVTDLISNFSSLQKRIFNRLATIPYQDIQYYLFNNMLSNCCYVFNVGVEIEREFVPTTEDRILLISFKRSINLPPYGIPDTNTPIPLPISAYSRESTTFRTGRIIPQNTRCVCDLAVSSEKSLTTYDLVSEPDNNNIFNITPVTFNDAASAATKPTVQYLDFDINMPFGNPQENPQENPQGKYKFIFHGITNNYFQTTYLPKISGLLHFYSLDDFNTKFGDIIEFLTIGSLENYYFKLLEIYKLKITPKAALVNASYRFMINYHNVLSDNMRETNKAALWNEFPRTEFVEAFRTPLEVIDNRLTKFYNDKDKTTNSIVKAVTFDKNTTIFQNLVIKIINWIRSETKRCQDILTAVQASASPSAVAAAPAESHGVSMCNEIYNNIKYWLDFIDAVMKPLLMDPALLSPLSAAVVVENSTKHNVNRRTKQITMGGTGDKTKKQSNDKENNIKFSSIFGKYGFYQKINEDGRFEISPINTPQELQSVWKTLGINVTESSTTSERTDVAKGVELTGSQEGQVRRLMASQPGLTRDQAIEQMNSTEWQLKQGKEKVIPPATNILQPREKYPELQQSPTTQNMVTNTPGTTKKAMVAAGGKHTKKLRHHNKKQKRKTFRKKQKCIVRRTRRK